MTLKITETLKVSGPEQFDVRDWRDMLNSRAYTVLLSRIDYMIEAQRKTLEQANSLDDMRKAQGCIEGLRAVKALGGVIEMELVERDK